MIRTAPVSAMGCIYLNTGMDLDSNDLIRIREVDDYPIVTEMSLPH
ncbi:MAG: hypothetical protein ACSLFI_01475 [Solirubrobacterales bacterium]